MTYTPGKTTIAPKVTIPSAYCPFCHNKMEEVQIVMKEIPNVPGSYGPKEVWNCDSCNTNHVFPARLAFLEYVGNTFQLDISSRVLHLPRNAQRVPNQTKVDFGREGNDYDKYRENK
jgi:hypothetical protein